MRMLRIKHDKAIYLTLANLDFLFYHLAITSAWLLIILILSTIINWNYITNHIKTTFLAAKLVEFAELPHVPISKIPCSPTRYAVLPHTGMHIGCLGKAKNTQRLSCNIVQLIWKFP